MKDTSFKLGFVTFAILQSRFCFAKPATIPKKGSFRHAKAIVANMCTKKMMFMAMLTAIALTIFIIEAQIPPLAPIPGIKLGLSNVVTLFALVTLGKKEAFTVMLMRVILGNIFAGSLISFLYSLSGGFVCFAVMVVSERLLKRNMLWSVSVFGAIGHNAGQIMMAVFITRTIQIAWYLPILMISAVITGAFTGLLTQYVLNHNNGFKKSMNGAVK